MSKGSMRTEMPTVAAFIDTLREAFGKDFVDDIIRRGMRGEKCFSATENGHSIGTPDTRKYVRIGRDARGNSIDLDNPDVPREPGRGGGKRAWER